MSAASSLRPIRPADESDLLRLYTDPLVRKYLGGPVSPHDAVAKIAALHSAPVENHIWAICGDPPIKAILGLVTLSQHHDGKEMELSYALLPEHQGKGHATRAVQHALAHAFVVLQIERVVVETQTSNRASVALATRLGMRLERTVVRFGEQQSLFIAESTQKTKSAALYLPDDPSSK
jgi:ribosomal-protein-alanine N-acetyltransferase